MSYQRQYGKKDKRVALSSDVIEGIKSIKYLGWEYIFQMKIARIRSEEFKYITTTRLLDGLLSVFWNSIQHLLLYFFLSNYVNAGNDLKSSNVFTIIALFGNLTGPIGILPWSISYIAKTRVSFHRIKNFLKVKDIDCSRRKNRRVNLFSC